MRMGQHERKAALERREGRALGSGVVWNSRMTAVGVCALLAVGTVLVYVQEAWLAALAVIFGDGVIAAGWVAAAAMLGSLLIPRLRGGDGRTTEWPLYVVTSAAAGLGMFSLMALGLGLAGGLSRWVAIALPVGSAGIWVTRIALRRGNVSLRPHVEALEAWLREPAGWGWWWLAAMPFLGVMLAGATLPPGILWKPGDPHPYDVLEYHLQVPREWYELGRIVPLKHNVYGFFPFNVEMQYLLAMYVRGGPWEGMYLAQLMSAAYMVLAVAGVYASVRAVGRREMHGEKGEVPLAGGHPRGWRVAAAVLAGVGAATVPWVSMLGSVAYNEAGLLLYGTLTLGWIAVAMVGRTQRVASLGIAGVMAGLACGVKYTGVPMFLVAAPVIVAGVAGVWAAMRREAWRALAAGIVVYVLIGLAVFSPWLVRNWRWTGNPVFPEAMGQLGQGHFSETQVERWEKAHSQRADQKPWRARLAAGWEQVVSDWRYGYVLLPLGVLAAGIGLRRAHVVFWMAMLLALSGFWLGWTHLQSRFFVLAVPIAAMLLGTIRNKWNVLGLMVVIVAMAASGLGRLDGALSPTMSILRQSGAVGLQDLSLFLPEEIGRYVKSGAKVALVGDAQAFAYVMPMADLKYRTIFDLDVEAGEGFVDAWLGEDAEAIRRDHYLVIDRGELQRFWATYAKVPLPEALGRGSEPIVVPPRGGEAARHEWQEKAVGNGPND